MTCYVASHSHRRVVLPCWHLQQSCGTAERHVLLCGLTEAQVMWACCPCHCASTGPPLVTQSDHVCSVSGGADPCMAWSNSLSNVGGRDARGKCLLAILLHGFLPLTLLPLAVTHDVPVGKDTYRLFRRVIYRYWSR